MWCSLPRKINTGIQKYKQTQQDDKYPTVLRNPAKSHQKCLQTYHDLIANKKIPGWSLYTAQDWKNHLIVTRKNYDPALPRGNSSDVKPNIIEVDTKIGHKYVMAISRFFMDRDDPDHLVDQMIHDMEGIGDSIAEVANIMDNCFVIYFSVDGSATL